MALEKRRPWLPASAQSFTSSRLTTWKRAHLPALLGGGVICCSVLLVEVVAIIHPGFAKASRKLGRRKSFLLPAPVFGGVGFLPSPLPAAGMWGVCWAVPFNGNSLFAPLQQCQEVNEPHKEKSRLLRCQLGKLKMPPWLWGFLPACPPRCFGAGGQGLGTREVEVTCSVCWLLPWVPIDSQYYFGSCLVLLFQFIVRPTSSHKCPAGRHHLHVLVRRTDLKSEHHSASACGATASLSPDLRCVRWSAGRQVTSLA